MSIYVTSDFHFNHDKSFIYEPRGCSSIEESNRRIIDRYNATVNEEDTIYILGDIALGMDLASIYKMIKELKGHKYLIIGNHDTTNKISFYKENCLFEDIQYGYRIRKGKKHFFLSHYPTIVANHVNENYLWNIHGHTHSSEKFNEYPKCYNVSVEAHDCYPVAIESIIEDIKENAYV